MSDSPMIDRDDDLEQAYARAHALRDGEAGPAASVRANVLAAAAAVAATQAAAQSAAPPLKPVAAPVADVGSERGDAPNLSSWRVRSGAAFAALLVVGLALWRFDATHHTGGVLVAQADSALEARAIPEPAPPLGEPRELPAPRQSLPPPPAYAPPAVVADVAEPTVVLVPPALPPRELEREAVIAQADTATAARSKALGYRPPSAMAPAAAAAAAPPQQAQLAQSAAPAAASAAAPAPVMIAAAPPPPTDLYDSDRRAAAPKLGFNAASPASAAGDIGILPDTEQQVVVAGIRAPGVAGSLSRLPGISAAAKKSASTAMASAMGEPPRAPGSSLHAAAATGDTEALRRLLADPATRVDEPDSLGRTALMVAVTARRVAAVRVLMAAGADPDHADASGATPRSVARTGPNAEIAALLGIVR